MIRVPSRPHPLSKSAHGGTRPGQILSDMLFGSLATLPLTLTLHWPALEAGFIWNDDSMLFDTNVPR
jgi:hypothetical protein